MLDSVPKSCLAALPNGAPGLYTLLQPFQLTEMATHICSGHRYENLSCFRFKTPFTNQLVGERYCMMCRSSMFCHNPQHSAPVSCLQNRHRHQTHVRLLPQVRTNIGLWSFGTGSEIPTLTWQHRYGTGTPKLGPSKNMLDSCQML